MTKEDILEAVALDVFSLEQILDEFFNSNVVIPRGENRNSCADVLHEWVEGTKLEFNRGDGTWHHFCIHDGNEYRIKPSEPVFEWQWYYIDNGVAKIHPEFMTYGEVTDFRHSFIIEETKRVRQ